MPELEDQPQAAQAITYALNSEHCVLEFSENENGEMQIMDVTDHFEALEQLAENE